MKKTVTIMLIAIASSLATPVNAGGPKESHPCYAVADCKAQESLKAFSQCIKSHKEEANAIAECAEFRKDKKAYMKKKGIAGVEALFNE